MFLQKLSMSLPLLLDQNIWTLYWSEAAGADAAGDARASSALCRVFPPLFNDHYLLNSLGSGCDFKVNCGPFLYPDALQHQWGGPAGAGLQSTSILRTWFSEHRRNPYPTRGEKIMLAIITRMTLTQVSTWFANARRRLKKENRTIWPPAVCKSCFSCETTQVTEDTGQDHLVSQDRCERAVKDPIDTGFEERIDLQSPAEQNLMKNQSSRKKPKIWSLAETATMVKTPKESWLQK